MIGEDPEILLTRIGRGEDVEPESFYDIALTRWLPRRSEGDRSARALETLAGLLEKRHHDRWLRDVLAVPRSERLQRGHVALSQAVEANREDDSGRAMVRSREAAALLRAAGDSAGALRAETELVYGLHRSFIPKECVDRALAVERDAALQGYSWILGQIRVELGICRAALGDLGGAYRDMTKAEETARTARFATLELRANGVLTAEQTFAGNVLASWEQSRSGLARFWSGAHPANRAQQYYTLLRGAAEQLDHKLAALAFARSSTEMIAETHYRSTEAVGRALVANLAAQAGFRDEAAKQSRIADRLLAGLEDSKASLEHRLFAGIALAEVGAVPAESLRRLEALREPMRQSDALLTELRFHQAFGNAHRRAGDLDAAGKAWSLAVRRYEERLGSLTLFDDRLNAMRVAREAYRGMVTVKWGGGQGIQAALEEWEWFRHGEWPGPRKRSPLPLDRLRRETFLAYSELPDGMVVWAFDNRGVKGARIGVTREELRRTAERFSRLCADQRSDLLALRRLGAQLYQWLVAPVEDRLDVDRTLVIEPDGAVSAVPFAALIDGQSRWLGQAFDIVVASGVWDYLRRGAHPGVDAGVHALIVADPQLTGDASRAFPPLPGASREGKSVAARFSTAVVLAGGQATLEAVNRNRPDAGIFHFAGHGYSHSGNGGLLLAPSGGNGTAGSSVLDGKSLAGQDWSRCRLAVLSACSTGTGESGGPVNPESLVRRLLWAGVPRVIASRWRADSETTLKLMDVFYSGLLSGLDTPAALRSAGRRIQEREDSRHPYYWAGFQAFGTR